MPPAAKNKPGDERATKETSGAVLAIDYGRKRIGLALASMETRLVNPLSILERKNRREDVRRLRELVREHGVKRIVVGLPLRTDGTRGEMTGEAERFAERLRKHIALPVVMQDERLTTWVAEQLLKQKKRKTSHRGTERAGKRRRTEGRNAIDAIAAAVILRDYLEREVAKKELE
jgi:putative Holliday junction resolvase